MAAKLHRHPSATSFNMSNNIVHCVTPQHICKDIFESHFTPLLVVEFWNTYKSDVHLNNIYFHHEKIKSLCQDDKTQGAGSREQTCDIHGFANTSMFHL